MFIIIIWFKNYIRAQQTEREIFNNFNRMCTDLLIEKQKGQSNNCRRNLAKQYLGTIGTRRDFAGWPSIAR